MTELTIDELARRTGTTSRNIRAYQEKGLLPPPTLVGRTGYYDETHVARLRHVTELLARGFSLAAIKEVFDAWERGYGLAGLLGLEEALDTSWQGEAAPRVLTRAQLEDEYAIDSDETLAGSVALGLLVQREDGWEVPSPQVLAAARDLRAAGLPVEALLQEGALLAVDLDRIAARWVALFLDRVWQPYVVAGMPPEDLSRITGVLKELPPLALATIQPLFARAMERRVAASAAEALTIALTVTPE
jgi:DNA-binding transcriptional MerR regulator